MYEIVETFQAIPLVRPADQVLMPLVRIEARDILPLEAALMYFFDPDDPAVVNVVTAGLRLKVRAVRALNDVLERLGHLPVVACDLVLLATRREHAFFLGLRQPRHAPHRTWLDAHRVYDDAERAEALVQAWSEAQVAKLASATLGVKAQVREMWADRLYRDHRVAPVPTPLVVLELRVDWDGAFLDMFTRGTKHLSPEDRMPRHKQPPDMLTPIYLTPDEQALALDVTVTDALGRVLSRHHTPLRAYLRLPGPLPQPLIFVGVNPLQPEGQPQPPPRQPRHLNQQPHPSLIKPDRTMLLTISPEDVTRNDVLLILKSLPSDAKDADMRAALLSLFETCNIDALRTVCQPSIKTSLWLVQPGILDMHAEFAAKFDPAERARADAYLKGVMTDYFRLVRRARKKASHFNAQGPLFGLLEVEASYRTK